MNKQKNGTNVYKAVCAVVFIIFSFVYLFYYQTDILAAAQHIASGGRTHYEPVLGSILIVIALKLLQNGIQAIAKLKRIFFALTYFPSFLILTFITDIPSGNDQQINFGAWAWALPLTLIVWAFLVFLARQYQPIEVEARSGGVLSQVVGVNITLILAMMLMTCLIGNHNRLFHQRMHVEFLVSRKDFKEAQNCVENYHANDACQDILRAYSLAKQHLIGEELFKSSLSGAKSIIPSSYGTYTVIVPMDNLLQYYKRDADWQLCEMLVKKNLSEFYDNLMFFYNLGTVTVSSDSTGAKTIQTKEIKKQNAYKDSLLAVRFQKLPLHYQEALVLYNDICLKHGHKRPPVNPNYLDKELVSQYKEFLITPLNEREKKFKGTYWIYFTFKNS